MTMWEPLGKIALCIMLTPVALTFLGAAMIMCNGGAGYGFYGSENPSLSQHIKMFFLVGVVTAIIFGLIGGLGWGFWTIFQLFGIPKELSFLLATLLSVPIVTIGWYHGTGAYWAWRKRQGETKSDGENEDAWRVEIEEV